ncbi:MAG TPA: aminopeptidase [Firmicutes bacterium]|nr:aminopeptidase [Bacillota bacterium]
MSETTIVKYAELVVKTGINLQKGQTLVITSPLECAGFARQVAKAAYLAGARDVVMNWNDEQFNKIRYLHAPEEVFAEFPEWRKDFYLSYARAGAGFVSISAADPELLQDADPQRIALAQKTANTHLREFRERTMNNLNAWCVISAPTEGWARKVFPGDEKAVEKLWQAILHSVRADRDNPVAAWEEHKRELSRRVELLNAYRFRSLHFTNSLGTDLVVELPEGHLWQGGSDVTRDGVEFIANMPTEEIFTVPHKNGVSGIVFNSRPLVYNGNIIDGFSLTLKEGRIVDFSAKVGAAHLQHLLETDEGSRRFGEVALVPYDSPISQSKILFYNTLFDENASCHFAIGRGYPGCLQNGDRMNREELIAHGCNDSLLHEDFMIGTADLQITGTTADGKQVRVFARGNFTF